MTAFGPVEARLGGGGAGPEGPAFTYSLRYADGRVEVGRCHSGASPWCDVFDHLATSIVGG